MQTSRIFIGRWYVGYGLFLILCGVAGFLSNPEAAKTALMSGGTFGLLSAIWGFWMLKGGRLPAFLAAVVITGMLCAVFTWRSVVSWQSVLDGEPKRFAAALITSMLLASVLSLLQLFRERAAVLAK